jgi:hypothetical protein
VLWVLQAQVAVTAIWPAAVAGTMSPLAASATIARSSYPCSARSAGMCALAADAVELAA